MTAAVGAGGPGEATVPDRSGAERVDPPVTTHVADWFVVRVAALPAAELSGLRTVTTAGRVAEAVTQADAAAAVAEQLTADLYALVPALDDADPTARRAALRLRRDVHNGRVARPADLAAVLGHLGGGGQRLVEWDRAVRQRAAALAAAEAALGPELDQAWRAARAGLTDPAVLAGLALTSPTFCAELLAADAGGHPGPGSRPARSVTAYLGRTAAKTSPLSTLTTLGIGAFAGGHAGSGRAPSDRALPEPDRRLAGGAELIGCRALAVALLTACAANERVGAGIPLVLNPSLRRGRHGWRGVLVDHFVDHGTFFAVEHAADLNLYRGLLDDLLGEPDGQPRSLAGWAAWLVEHTGSGHHGALALARRWLAGGLLRVRVPWLETERRHLAGLAELIRRQPHPAAASTADAIDGLDGIEQRVREADARGRIEAIRALRRGATELFGHLGVPSPPWLSGAFLVHENVAHRAEPATLPPSVRDDLAQLARTAARSTIRSSLYDWLVDRFIARYGAGGRCTDIVDFLLAASVALEQGNTLLPVVERDRRQPGRRDHRAPVAGHGCLASPSLAVFFQVARTGAADDHDHLTVVNQLNGGTGGVIARWAGVPGIGPRIYGGLADWLAGLYPGCRVLQVTAGADWATLQLPAPGLPLLSWPGDLAPSTPAPDTVAVSTLTLVHDRRTGTLQTVDAAGQPVAFAYLGVVPEFRLSGAIRLLLTLSYPWQWGLEVGGMSFDQTRLTPPPGAVTAEPRRQHGRLVLGRARWLADPAVVPVRADREGWPHYLVRLRDWQRRTGIPPRGFVRIGRRTDYRPLGKPAWCDVDSPDTVAVALNLPADAYVVEFAEALPDPATAWHRGVDGRARVSEYLGLVRYAC